MEDRIFKLLILGVGFYGYIEGMGHVKDMSTLVYYSLQSITGLAVIILALAVKRR